MTSDVVGHAEALTKQELPRVKLFLIRLDNVLFWRNNWCVLPVDDFV